MLFKIIKLIKLCNCLEYFINHYNNIFYHFNMYISIYIYIGIYLYIFLERELDHKSNNRLLITKEFSFGFKNYVKHDAFGVEFLTYWFEPLIR